ncbi:MAG: glutamate 5-kinase [Chitinivibrionales bacterium]|nr:glutamate 5-kinase [Chitinivibrionales bacterium]MBD3396351.1 glutamate 5-kinase [Chitinivibrionales bacterium]
MRTIVFHPGTGTVETMVVKVGSRIVTSHDSLARAPRIRTLVEDIVTLHRAGIRVLLVSSGAIAHGVRALRLGKRPAAIPLQQACASVGQIRLMHMYETLFARRKVSIGQVLLTWDDLRDKKRYLNLRNTLFKLLDCGAVPILNENDSVGIEEIRFGDNDTLGAQVAMLVGADLFVNLTDTPGLFETNPRLQKNARHIPRVERITAATHESAHVKGSEEGVGGMVTKLKAAEMVCKAGMCAIIGDGYHDRLLNVLKNDTSGTLFVPSAGKMSSKHRWLAFSGRAHGAVRVDDGARRAVVERGKSLLPAGIKSVEGTFGVGDMVDIQDSRGTPFARGIVNYASGDVETIRGCRSGEIAGRLGQKTYDEVIHRDNLVLLKDAAAAK